jgi:hypothetical protein
VGPIGGPGGRATIVECHEDFLCPGRPRHAGRPEHSPSPEVSSGSLAGGRPHLVVLARNAGLQRRSMGLSFGTAATPRDFGLSAPSLFHFLYLFCPKYISIYIDTHRYFIWMMENSCRYTPDPLCPQPQ